MLLSEIVLKSALRVRHINDSVVFLPFSYHNYFKQRFGIIQMNLMNTLTEKGVYLALTFTLRLNIISVRHS
jgi:hypothetical protein